MSQSSAGAVRAGPASQPQVEEFLDIVLGDPDLLAAEFDAIVERVWGGEISATEPSTPRGVDGPEPSSSVAEPDATPHRGPAHPPGPRVRGPPGTCCEAAIGRTGGRLSLPHASTPVS